MPHKADGFAPIVTPLNLTLKMIFIDRHKIKNNVTSDIYFRNDLDHIYASMIKHLLNSFREII